MFHNLIEMFRQKRESSIISHWGLFCFLKEPESICFLHALIYFFHFSGKLFRTYPEIIELHLRELQKRFKNVDIFINPSDSKSLRCTCDFAMIMQRGDPVEASLEWFLLVNLMIDMALISIAARSCHAFRFFRVLLASLAATAYSVPAVCFSGSWSSVWLQFIFLMLLSWFIVGLKSRYAFVLYSLILSACAVLTSGLALKLRENYVITSLGILAGLLFAQLIFSVHRNLRNDWQTEIMLLCEDKTARFTALIDTGNRLHEPISGLPVLIVEAPLVKNILPKAGFRKVPFGALGGNGMLRCFKPDQVWIIEEGRKKRGPAIWVGVVYSPLPGSSRALAPSEFAAIP